MIATSHVIIGGTSAIAVGTITQNPVAALAAGIVSHIICDLIPHLDHPDGPKMNGDLVFTKKIIIFALTDSLVAFFLTLFLWIKFYDFPYITLYPLGALGAYLPDFFDNVPAWRLKIRKLPFVKQFHSLHQNIHRVWESRFPMPKYWFLGTITQIIVVGFCLYYLFV